MDNPIYGTTTTIGKGEGKREDDSISIGSHEFQTSFSNYCDEHPELFIPNTVIVNPMVDTGGRESTSPAPPTKGEEPVTVHISMSTDEKDNIYDNV